MVDQSHMKFLMCHLWQNIGTSNIFKDLAMNNLNLHKNVQIERWKRFDELYLNFNPAFFTTRQGRKFSIFRRVRYPIAHDNKIGDLWVVELNEDLLPIGDPKILLNGAEDPRVLVINDKLYVFFTLPIINNEGSITSTVISLAIFEITNGEIRDGQEYAVTIFSPNPLKKVELNGSWEKNWIPFVINESKLEIGIIYQHDPWRVIVMDASNDREIKLTKYYEQSGLNWNFGSIRGGTQCVEFDSDHLITFFHSSLLVGGMYLYMVGAVVFEKTSPFNPVMMTRQPIVISPHRDGIRKWGWPSRDNSVIYPIGIRERNGYFEMLSGLDDADIGVLKIEKNVLRNYLDSIDSNPYQLVYDFDQANITRTTSREKLYLPKQTPYVAEASIIKFFEILFIDGGNVFIDIGAHCGFYSVGLSKCFEKIYSFEPSKLQYEWLTKNIMLNNSKKIIPHQIAVSNENKVAKIHIASADGGGNSLDPNVIKGELNLGSYEVECKKLDEYDFNDVDLIKIDVEGLEIQVIQGAIETIMSNKPLILLEVWDDNIRRAKIQSLLDSLGYDFKFIFTNHPELAICWSRVNASKYNWII